MDAYTTVAWRTNDGREHTHAYPTWEQAQRVAQGLMDTGHGGVWLRYTGPR